MARPRSPTPKNVQVNVRLTQAQADGLAVIGALDDISAPELLRDLLENELRKWERDPDYVEVLRRRLARRAKRQGDVIAFPEGRDAG